MIWPCFGQEWKHARDFRTWVQRRRFQDEHCFQKTWKVRCQIATLEMKWATNGPNWIPREDLTLLNSFGGTRSVLILWIAATQIHCTTLTQSCAKASALACKRSHFNMMSHWSCQIGTMISYAINYHCLLALPSGLRSMPPTPHIVKSEKRSIHSGRTL